MTKPLARDLGADGVTVNAIAPGQIETDMGSLGPADRAAVEARIPLGRLGRPEDVGYAALYLASEAAGYVTGHTLDVNGGILFRWGGPAGGGRPGAGRSLQHGQGGLGDLHVLLRAAPADAEAADDDAP